MTLGEMVKTYRTEHGYSLRQFSQICGLSHQSIANIEKNEHSSSHRKIVPDIQTVKALAAGMGLTLQDVLEQTDNFELMLPTRPTTYTGSNAQIREIVECLEGLNSEALSAVLSYVRFMESQR